MAGGYRTPAPDDLGALVGEIEQIKIRLSELESPTGTSISNTLGQLQATVAAMPVMVANSARSTGIAMSSNAMTTYATTTLVVPAGKTSATVIVLGSAAILDETSGGVTSAYARLRIDGNASGDFPSAKDAGASQVNNVMNAQHSRTYTVVPGATITVDLQIQPLNYLAFNGDTENFALVTAFGIFGS